jgi:hypothetical protein
MVAISESYNCDIRSHKNFSVGPDQIVKLQEDFIQLPLRPDKKNKTRLLSGF